MQCRVRIKGVPGRESRTGGYVVSSTPNLDMKKIDLPKIRKSDHLDGYKEVWHLAGDFAVEDKVASHSLPDVGQPRASTFAAAMHPAHRYVPVPQGHF